MCLSTAVMVMCLRQCHRNSLMYNLRWQQIPRNQLFPAGKDRVVLWVSGCSYRLAVMTAIFVAFHSRDMSILQMQSHNTVKFTQELLNRNALHSFTNH